MNLQTIWIIDHYSSEPKYGGISRQYDFAKELGKRGYQVVVIASGFSHFTHQYICDKNIKINTLTNNIHFIYLKTARYKRNNSLKRAESMFSFLTQVLRWESRIAEKYGKPDVVTGCSVHPLSWLAAYRIAKKYSVRFVAEVRDFWPQIWIDSGIKKPHDPMVLLFGAIQKWVYKRADRIIYSLYHGDRYLCDELNVPQNKVFLIGQPMDCKRFDTNKEKSCLLPPQIHNFISNAFVCSFAGYYMAYEGVYVMLEALRILETRNLPVKMVFVGSGQEKEGMLKYIKENNLHNALVYDRIPREAIPALISCSDICMAHLAVEGHKEVYQYGVSKNKLNEYLYSGACTLYGFFYHDDEVSDSGGGIIFEPYNSVDLADKIEQIYRMSEVERRQYGIRGRAYIKNNHSVEVLTDKMLKVLFQ